MIRIAFTLAEVLITLAIIGVVAAMTIPSLIDKYKCVELKTGLKEAYSLLSQALIKMNTDLGYTVSPQNFARRTFKAQYMEYFDNPTDCEYGGRFSSGNAALCPSGSDSDDKHSSEYSTTYKIYNKSSDVQMRSTYIDDGQFALKNGMVIMIENSAGSVSENRLFISVDVNGIGRGPNAWGHDLFTFQLMEDGKLTPMGADDTMFPIETKSNYCSTSSTNVYNGLSCTYNAFTDENYFKNLPK